MLRFSFQDTRRTALFLVAIAAALSGPAMTIWNNYTIWKDDPAPWTTILETHIVPLSGMLYLLRDSLKARLDSLVQRDLIPHWLLSMNSDEAAAVVELAKATGEHGEPIKPEETK